MTSQWDAALRCAAAIPSASGQHPFTGRATARYRSASPRGVMIVRHDGRRAAAAMLLAFVAFATAVAGCARSSVQSAAPPADGLTIRLTSVPASTPSDAAIHVAGTFNGWNPGDPAHRLTRDADGSWVITLPATVRGPVEFKFTRGSWDAVELTASGGDAPNRAFVVPASGAATYTGSVAAWRAPEASAPRASTARATVTILDTAFAIPQLGRTRRVWLYLPPDYATSGKWYPVLYMQDGQNLFDAATSFAGEWGIDESLDSLHALGDPGIIVVGIDNGGTHRSNEYHPWPSATGRFGGGEGTRYAEFLAETLKPYIDARYRTKPGRLDTGVGGSSSGGVIAMYAGLRYPDVFGRVLSFSPAFFVNPQLFALARATLPRTPPSRFFLDAGLNETVPALAAGEFARTQREMVDTLAAAGVDVARDVRSLLPADGVHAEWFWRREFPAAYRWLFAP